MSARQPHYVLAASAREANAVIPFKFDDLDVRVISSADGEPLFLAMDVAQALGYADTEAMTRKLDEDEKQNLQIVGFGNRGVTVISEPGLYSAILTSQKPDAKRFKRWVTHEVLPSIRKTGAYATGAPAAAPRRQVDEATQALKMVPLGMRAAKAFGFDQNAAAISVNQYIRSVTGQNVLEGFGKTHLLAENQETQWFTPSELAGQAKMPVKELNLLLASAGFQKKRGKKWELLDAGRPHARIFDVGKQQGVGVPIQQLKWSPAVIDAARAAVGKAPGVQGALGLEPASD